MLRLPEELYDLDIAMELMGLGEMFFHSGNYYIIDNNGDVCSSQDPEGYFERVDVLELPEENWLITPR